MASPCVAELEGLSAAQEGTALALAAGSATAAAGSCSSSSSSCGEGAAPAPVPPPRVLAMAMADCAAPAAAAYIRGWLHWAARAAAGGLLPEDGLAAASREVAAEGWGEDPTDGELAAKNIRAAVLAVGPRWATLGAGPGGAGCAAVAGLVSGLVRMGLEEEAGMVAGWSAVAEGAGPTPAAGV